MSFDPISYILAKKKVSWNEVKNKLATEGAVNVLYDTDKDNLVDQLASHSHVRADITDLLPITRADLEYPTENVNLAYLTIIGKTTYWREPNVARLGVVTTDSFTDKAVKVALKDYGSLLCRFQDYNNFYHNSLESVQTTQDTRVYVRSGGTFTLLGYEAVDINADSAHLCKAEVVGSTINFYREDMTTPKVSVTDTTFSSGAYGSYFATTKPGDVLHYSVELLAPTSPLPQPARIFETDVIGSGKENDPFRPNLLRDLREISTLTGLPDFLYREAKKYEILKAKGFTDEEIELLFGSIPQHQVDLASVTFGSFEFRHDSPTNIIVVYSDNPYQSGAILKQEEAVKSKNLRVLKPPRDYLEAKQQYQELRKEFTEWLAGKDNFAYQMIGHEDFEAMQTADFYFGELLEHKTHYDQIKRVPDWEIRRNLNRWKERLKKGKILAEEREKHLRKLEEIERLGW